MNKNQFENQSDYDRYLAKQKVEREARNRVWMKTMGNVVVFCGVVALIYLAFDWKVALVCGATFALAAFFYSKS